MGPNRRAQEREHAVTRAAEEAKRAKTERKAVADAQKIVAIWNARQVGRRELWFYPTIGRHCGWLPVALLLLSGVSDVRISRSQNSRSSSRCVYLKPDPIAVVPAVLPACAVRKARIVLGWP